MIDILMGSVPQGAPKLPVKCGPFKIRRKCRDLPLKQMVVFEKAANGQRTRVFALERSLSRILCPFVEISVYSNVLWNT